MQYTPPIITDALKWDDLDIKIPLGVKGDTVYISLTPDVDKNLYVEEVPSLPLTPKPAVYLDLQYKSLVAQITEGESFDIKVKVTQPVADDVTVFLDLVAEDTLAPAEGKLSEEIQHYESHLDLASTFFRPVDVTKLSEQSGSVQIIIPAGDTEAFTTITTTDDTVLTNGKGFYEALTVRISGVSGSADVMQHMAQSEGCVLIEDANEYPLWSGDVEVWGRIHEFLDYEPLIDPDTSGTVKIEFGDQTLRTKICDDVPLQEIWLRPDQETLPSDVAGVEDLTVQLPLFRAIINTGRRD